MDWRPVLADWGRHPLLLLTWRDSVLRMARSVCEDADDTAEDPILDPELDALLSDDLCHKHICFTNRCRLNAVYDFLVAMGASARAISSGEKRVDDQVVGQ